MKGAFSMQPVRKSSIFSSLRTQAGLFPLIYLAVALLAPVLANRNPLAIQLNGRIYFPAFSNSPYIQLTNGEDQSTILKKEIDWRIYPCNWKIMAPVPYSPNDFDPAGNYLASPFGKQKIISSSGTTIDLPLRYRHWLGTTRTGQDVLAELIHGCRTSIFIGLASIFLAGLIGLLLGTAAGFFGNDRLILSFALLLSFSLAFFTFLFYAANGLTNGWNSVLVLLLCIIIGWITNRVLRIFDLFRRPVKFPTDRFLQLITACMVSIPRLILVLTLAAVITPSITSLVLIISLTGWTEIARVTRNETLRIRKSNYLEYATSAGFPPLRIILHHTLPNTMSFTHVMLLYGIAGAILTEAGLSFIGIGLPSGTPSWGALFFAARQDFSAWWLVLFPGFVLIGLLSSLYNLADRMKSIRSHRMDE